jgi:hypothetical protein
LPAFNRSSPASQEQIGLTNNIAIRVLTGSYRSVRGYARRGHTRRACVPRVEEGRILTDESLVQRSCPASSQLAARSSASPRPTLARVCVRAGSGMAINKRLPRRQLSVADAEPDAAAIRH